MPGSRDPGDGCPGSGSLYHGPYDFGSSYQEICFEAFLPADKKERQQILDELKEETRTIVIYEAPHRLVKTLRTLEETLGGDRQVRVCRELTKKHETVYENTLSGAAAYYEEQEPKGECVLVVEGKSRTEIRKEQQAKWEEIPLAEHMERYLSEGMSKKEAMKQVAKDRGISKRDVYQALLSEEE